jgi:hypothetical protein
VNVLPPSVPLTVADPRAPPSPLPLLPEELLDDELPDEEGPDEELPDEELPDEELPDDDPFPPPLLPVLLPELDPPPEPLPLEPCPPAPLRATSGRAHALPTWSHKSAPTRGTKSGRRRLSIVRGTTAQRRGPA